MLKTLNTLMRGLAAEAEEAVIDHNAVRILDQKIRDAEAGLKAAKLSLAGLIKKDRLEESQVEKISARISDLEARVRAALAAGDDALAETGAQAIAELEAELGQRETTRRHLAERIDRLRHSLGTAARRMADLRHAAATARAVEQERRGQARLVGRSAGSGIAEAEAMVERIMGQDDPFEDDRILAEIDAGLTGKDAERRLSEAGYGPGARPSAESVLARLRPAT